MHGKYYIGLQYFGEPENQDRNRDFDFEELYNTNDAMKNFVANRINQAVEDYRQKQQKINDDKLSEAEKLKEMTSEEIASYYKSKYENAELEKQKLKNAESLKTQTIKLLADNKIPSDFISGFDFENVTAEEIKEKIGFLSKYEIYDKGMFETKLNAALSDKLKQKSPESKNQSTGNDETKKLRKYFGL